MTTLSSGLEAALGQPHVLEFYALEILLPSYSLRLINGSGFVAFDSGQPGGPHTFVGRDPTYGTWAGGGGFEDGVDNQSPGLSITLLPPDTTAAATLADPGAQGSTVSIWYGAVDPATGLVVDDPHLEFVGYVDVPIFRPGAVRSLEYECGSEWDRLFPRDDGARLNGAFHSSVWPGEQGLDYVSEVQRQLPWGQDAPRPTVVRDVRPVGGGGGGGGVSPFPLDQVVNGLFR